MTSPRTAWLAFFVLGALETVVLLEFPIAGILLLLLALVGIAWRPPRGAALAGLIAGIGAMWTFLMVRVQVSCDASNATPGESCQAPGIEGWILVGVALLVVGAIATLAVLRRSVAR